MEYMDTKQTAISFSSHGDKMSGNLFTPTAPAGAAFLFIQGWTGHQNVAAAQALASLGFTSMTYDMRGNKSSEGDLSKLSRADFLNDAVLAYDFLKQHIGSQTEIGVVGSSFGSYTGILLSEQRPVKCLSLRVPASYPDEGFNDPQEPQSGTPALTKWRRKEVSHSQNKAFGALHNFKGYVQIVEAENDEIVTHQVATNYANAIADKRRLQHDVMQGAPHTLANEQLSAEYVKLLTEWAQKVCR